jgi:hypothetical protein
MERPKEDMTDMWLSMTSYFDSVVAVDDGKSQHMHILVTITTTLIQLLMTKTKNTKYSISTI